ncbi:multi-sensor signal transduction histidine kinase [Paenibacillus mucilaginosus 3016]|uniref:histidine kinase n=1 Tax=Paenibacillus mucilaginosus 3016 TaxID=1116391 RepID=H6NC46_9BACL|nr:sensor histidine kinase [Paenibacillus mucilaginosus]AFC28239.1 multi-sensor signal transduction histidine kinase [Paenibacillus mucilaginosus 3016]WFA17059.1 sensor histidine kinase [Paenibacillus mucilaginosus]
MRLVQRITSSLRAKLLTIFVLLTMIPLIGEGLISYMKSYQTVSEHSTAANALIAEGLRRDIDILFQDTTSFLQIRKSPPVLRFLTAQSETYEDAKEILHTFELYRETYKLGGQIVNISMVNTYGKGISEKKGVFQMDADPLKNPHFLTLLNNPEQTLIIPPQAARPEDRMDGSDYEGRRVISIAKAVTQRVTHEIIGFILIDMDDRTVENFCNTTLIGETGFFYVVDEQGNPIFLPSRVEGLDPAALTFAADTDKGSRTDRSAGEPLFYVHTRSEMTGWSIVGRAPLKEIMRDADEIKSLTLYSVLFNILFTVSLYFFLTNRLIRPVQYLKNKMRQAASGNLDAKARNTGTDEIADLGHSFNIMLGQIKQLLERSLKEQEQIKKAELRTLQAQINPHFLYNTLESIMWMAETRKHDEVIALVKALSQFFRITLSKGRDQIHIKSELDHIENYLVIQRMRYRDILDYEVDLPEELNPYPIVKMSLQPLVENALYHGIKNKRGRGLIRITGGFTPDGDIRIEVRDNGAGIPGARLAQLQEQLAHGQSAAALEADASSSGGFGLLNVHQRIRLHYGSPYGVSIESEYGVGSCISVRIPAAWR